MNGLRTKQLEKVSFGPLTATITKDIGLMGKHIIMVCTNRPLGVSTLESGRTICSMGKAKKHGKTEAFIQESILTVKKVVKESMFMLIKVYMTECGLRMK